MTRVARAAWFAVSGVAGLVVLFWLNTHGAPRWIQALCGMAMAPAFALSFLMARD